MTTNSPAARQSVVVGQRIRDRRKTLGLSQAVLAVEANVHVNTLRYVELGGSCHAVTRHKIEDALTDLEALRATAVGPVFALGAESA